MVRILISLILSVLLITYVVWAEEKKDETKKEKETKLEEIVVTATRTEKEIEEAPGSVAVVIKEEIEKRSINTLDDIVNNISGIYVHRTRVIMDTPTDAISLRGIPGNRRNLIMLDGIPINDPQGGGIRLGGLRFEDVERIEAVKGPFSSLYGGLAMGGVVNIITKLPEKREFTVKTGYGSGFERGEAHDDVRKFYISYGDRLWNKLSLFVSYGYGATNGFSNTFNVQRIAPPTGITGWIPTTDTQGNPRYIIGDAGDNRWWDESITLRAGYDFTEKTKLSLTLSRIRSEANYDDPPSYLRDATGNVVWRYGTPPNSVEQASFLAGSIGKEIYVYNLKFETEISNVKTKLTMGVYDQDRYLFTTPCYGIITGCLPTSLATITGGPGKTHNTKARSYNADLQFTLPLFNNHILTFGGSYRQGRGETDEYNLTNWKDENSKTSLIYQSKGKDRIYALFIQDEILLMNNLTAYLGLRQDWWETYDGYENEIGTSGYPRSYGSKKESSLNPKVSLVYKPFEDTTLKGSLGKAFRPPMIIELYRKFMTPGSFIFGNPNLKPEKSISWDLGVEQKLWKGSKVGLTYFHNNLKDLIYSRTTGQKIGFRDVVETVNAGKAVSRGVEFEFEQRFDKWLKLFANFTYTDTEIKENPAKPETVGKKLTGMPEKMFNIGGEIEKGPLTVSLIGRYRSKVFNNDENKDSVNGVYGSYDPYFVADAKISYKLTKFATVSLSVNNILDREYYYFYKEPGRSWYGELTMRF
ncbi:MAG: TonB-dependent receptor [Thermodesulfovibrionales bacterium]|nr:TonB-dependent receptor [Thermodesulfovibrionales bacterium]